MPYDVLENNPTVTAAITGNQSFDKNWIVCDDTSTSPFYGNCYTEWDDNGNGNLLKMSTSSDGGSTWSTAATNATGTTWATITRVPIDGTTSGIEHMIPGLTVNKATSGSTAQLGITYYFYASGSSSLQVGFISSTNAGSTWSAPTTIFGGTNAFPTNWTATTSQGRMVGDYISGSYGSDNLAHGVYTIASAPTTGSGTSCTTSALDNCNEPVDSFATGLASGTVVAPHGPILSPPPNGGSHHEIWKLRHVEGDF